MKSIWSHWLLIFCLLQRSVSEDTTTGCENGWSEHRGNCFMLNNSEEPISWFAAETQCNHGGANLASIRDHQEMNFLDQMLVHYNLTQTEAYIGLKLDINIGEYRWTDGRPMIYTHWFIPKSATSLSERQPDGGWLEACTMVLSSDAASPTSHWHDIPCAAPRTRQFICVKQAKPRQLHEMHLRSRTVGCSKKFFTCSSGECIHNIFICDGSRDCTDGSDERNCENDFGVIWHKADITNGCGVDQVRCRDNYQCISVSYLCDFIPHCQDGSDEMQCVYPICNPWTDFLCDNGQCIDLSKRCDLIEDCPDGSDETACDYSSVGFQCFDGTWLPLSAKCDGQVDCPGRNWEDEPPECKNHTKVGNEFECKNGASAERNKSCQYDIDKYGFPIGCRDMTHLAGCEESKCSETSMKCPDSYCINIQYRCDGKWDCPNGEDEQQCNDFTCHGFYRCRGSKQCLMDDHICDGIKQCPDGDDELFCDTHCPAGCTCIGHSYSCKDITWDAIKAGQLPGGLRQLNLISVDPIPNVNDNSTIENILFVDLKRLKMLFILDISKNGISYLRPGQFEGNSNLKKLIVSVNTIYHLQGGSFTGLHALEYLDLSGNSLITIDSDVFSGLKHLVFLDMTTTNDMEVRPSKALFDPLTRLKTLWSSEFMICCMVGDSDTISDCLPGDSNEFSNCEDLICNKFLRLFMWVLGVSALIGNAFVVVWRTCGVSCLKASKKSSVQSILVSNLAIADLLMGVYMLIIAAADKYYRPRFMEEAHGWKTGIVCNIAGFLAVLSSEASIFFLTIISLDRFICISFPFSSKKLTTKTARIAVLAVWAIVFLISAIPPMAPGYFGEKYYGRSSVCLALPLISRHRTRGYHYSLGIFLGLNLVLFLIMLCCYVAMYFIVNASSKSIQSAGKSQHQQVQLAIRMGFLIGTNFVCWMPIIICGLLSVAEVWELRPVIYAWVAVFVLPLNASLNPYLYTILTHEMARKKGKMGSRDSTSTSKMSISETMKRVKIKAPKAGNKSLSIMAPKSKMNDGIDQKDTNFNTVMSGDKAYSSLFKKAIEDQLESRIFLVRNMDHYTQYLMSNYMKKTDKWSGFTEKDIEVIKQDLEDAVRILHRKGIKHGSVDEEHVLVEEIDGSKRYFLVLSAITEWQKTAQNGSKEPTLSDFEQLQKLVTRLPRV
ncbi:uncharacterized protein [Amphiura filiformis]|uniref:uncharacterized protein isoform X2 n=1 Tax=Amphiura filiformis TaxID=82378 RepID=UPI003B20E65B